MDEFQDEETSNIIPSPKTYKAELSNLLTGQLRFLRTVSLMLVSLSTNFAKISIPPTYKTFW
jgi:hypothetical protein